MEYTLIKDNYICTFNDKELDKMLEYIGNIGIEGSLLEENDKLDDVNEALSLFSQLDNTHILDSRLNGKVKLCPKCRNILSKSDTKGYAYQCFGCDEDFYEFEVK